MKAELHPRETERLAALLGYGVLDTPRDAAFDEVVEVLSAICDAPIALIALIDSDRQWFKAKIGTAIPETPRELSFCAHAILEPGMLIVPDAQKDARFQDNPLVTGEPNLRFYAGALLETEDGLPLGTVCVLDYKPRELDERQKRALQLMARQVMRQLELGRMLEAEKQARQRAEDLAEQNAVLAREIDHRVKNSLQIVSSMLSLQGRQAVSADVRGQLAEAENRVRAVSAVHEALHRAAQSDRVAVDQFLHSLCRQIAGNSPPNVELSSVAEPAAIRSDQASAVGLLVNELVANAFKHAFPGGRHGTVRIEGERDGGDYILRICDDGAGMRLRAQPSSLDSEPGAEAGTGLGMRILAALAQQLETHLDQIDTQQGTTLQVRFQLPDQSAAAVAPAS